MVEIKPHRCWGGDTFGRKFWLWDKNKKGGILYKVSWKSSEVMGKIKVFPLSLTLLNINMAFNLIRDNFFFKMVFLAYF